MTPELNVQVIYSIVYDVYILYSSGSGTRTHTDITAQRILSPLRLPISPFRHLLNISKNKILVPPDSTDLSSPN